MDELTDKNMDELKPFYIIGAGGFGRETAWLAERMNETAGTWEIKGFIDDNSRLHGKSLGGYPVLGGLDYLERQESSLWTVMAVGNAEARKRGIERLRASRHIHFATLVDPDAVRSGRVSVGEGSIICAGTVITVDVKIGRHSIINLDCTVGHDAELADYVTLYPSVNVSGMVNIGEAAEVGTGAHIIQGITIGEGSVIGAGAVVVRDVESYVTAVGNPAKVIKHREKIPSGG